MQSLDATFTPQGVTYAETDFEKRRGLSRVDLRTGFAQVHVSGLPLSPPPDGGGDLMMGRIALLDAVAREGVSIDLLKLTPTGMSFLIAETDVEKLKVALEAEGAPYTVEPDRAILLAHAVNMRDEEGMIAEIMREAIGGGLQIDHASDMHDRMLLVLASPKATALAERLVASNGEGNGGGRIDTGR